MIPLELADKKKFAVLGLGRSGLSAARALQAGGGIPLCWDDDPEKREIAAAQGFRVVDLTHKPNWSRHKISCLIVSPGIPHLYPAPHPAIERAWEAGVPVDNDVGLFFRHFSVSVHRLVLSRRRRYNLSPPVIICITGSNGKSTTTALIQDILVNAGFRAQMGGNIGRGVLDLDPPPRGGAFVLELSSYQLELARSLNPGISVFLNFSPDHYDRHGGRGGYLAAKARLFTDGAPHHAVIGVDEPEGRFLAGRWGRQSLSRISLRTELSHSGVSVIDGQLVERDAEGEVQARVDLTTLPTLKGEHNFQNCAAAWAVCRVLGLSSDDILAGMQNFAGLPHRTEVLGRMANVLFVNDSKATNIASTRYALSAFDDIFWIAGGQAKAGESLEALRPYYDRVQRAYLIGEAARDFAAILDGEVPYCLCDTLERAVSEATRDALQSKLRAPVVLLSPACASFDQFQDFAQRGDRFRELVADLMRRQGR